MDEGPEVVTVRICRVVSCSRVDEVQAEYKSLRESLERHFTVKYKYESNARAREELFSGRNGVCVPPRLGLSNVYADSPVLP